MRIVSDDFHVAGEERSNGALEDCPHGHSTTDCTVMQNAGGGVTLGKCLETTGKLEMIFMMFLYQFPLNCNPSFPERLKITNKGWSQILD